MATPDTRQSFHLGVDIKPINKLNLLEPGLSQPLIDTTGDK